MISSPGVCSPCVSTSKTRASFSNFRFVEDKRKNMSIASLQFYEFCQGPRDRREYYLVHVIEQPNFQIPNPQYLQQKFCFDFFNDSENTF